VYPTPFHERLAAVVGQRSSRHIGDLTSTNHETVRRYLTGFAPSIEFVQAVCKAFGVSAEWLLTGKGPMKASDIRRNALREADAGELLTALATTVETLIARVDRLEILLQSMETRLRALSPSKQDTTTNPDSVRSVREEPHGQAARTKAQAIPEASPRITPTPEPPAAPGIVVDIPGRVLRLRDAFPKRPDPDAR
jgi:transcriptional regulator with XRE-family HTH domain